MVLSMTRIAALFFPRSSTDRFELHLVEDQLPRDYTLMECKLYGQDFCESFFPGTKELIYYLTLNVDELTA